MSLSESLQTRWQIDLKLSLRHAGVTKATVKGFKVFQKTKSLKTLVLTGGAFKNNATHDVQKLLPGVEVRNWPGRR